ncbi:MAG: hypothetical protein H6Q54_1516, partial [Deltaproteobacteria bacterium]|nr:hypothetical protein [Deltaproteobacteria bacterium]
MIGDQGMTSKRLGAAGSMLVAFIICVTGLSTPVGAESTVHKG